MTRIGLTSIVLAVICLGAVAAHTPLIANSIQVGWGDSARYVSLTRTELKQLKDPDELRLAAENFASLEDRSVKASARYVVYLYAALFALAISLGIIGYLARSASNNRWRGP